MFSTFAAVAAALLSATVGVISPLAAEVAPRPQSEAKVSAAERTLTAMSLPQRVGQLFMVGTSAAEVDQTTRSQIGRFHVGNVMLTGRSHRGVAPPARVSQVMRQQVSGPATRGVRLFVATDQEGGLVRVLQGPGFSSMPTALEQGSWRPARLRQASERWARELRRSGVNLNLAPVLDTVPSPRAAEHNPPIGRYHRQFGYTPKVVARHGRAFLEGQRDGGVVPAVKHFPGLGRVRANPDNIAGVTDRVTTRHDAYLKPFRAAARADVPFVMMSTAIYRRLDPDRPAAFSPYVIKQMLRGDLGFDGVVISDDLGGARQVAGYRPAARAVRFIGAGGDMVLTVDAAPLPAMYRAVLTKARNDPRFRARVEAAALRVLTAKQREHLLSR